MFKKLANISLGVLLSMSMMLNVNALETSQINTTESDVSPIAMSFLIDIVTDDNGTVTTSKSSATPGEEITITVEPKEGYEIDKLDVFKVAGPQMLEVKDNKFTMPEGNVAINATFKEKTTAEEQPTTPSEEENVTTSYKDGNILFESEEPLSKEYSLKTNELDINQDQRDALKIDGFDLIMGYNISMFKDDDLVKLENGSFQIKIPVEDLYDTYKVAYVKDNKIVETIDAKYADGYVVFNTTHLSEYYVYGAINETPINTANPQTLDNISLYFTLAIISMGITGLAIKKFNN